MTNQTPIERAAQAIRDDWQAGMKATEMDLRDARTAYEAIDTDELADVIREIECQEGWMLPFTGIDHLALAVKNWLTGNN